MKLLKEYSKAIKNGYSILAFNFSNMEQLQAIVEGAEKQKHPVICSVSSSAIQYMGWEILISMFKGVKKKATVPIFLHLDHGKDFEICKMAVDYGFDSVMIDASSLPFKENVDITKKVCEYAHSKNVCVEAELGSLKGIEDDICNTENVYTSPLEAKEFIKSTNCDSLAIAIGTSHGAYKFSGTPTLRFDILTEIENQLPLFPLVLHGASSVPLESLAKFKKFGGKISNAKGVPTSILAKAAHEHNIVKINVDTDLRIEFTAELRKFLIENPNIFDPRKYLGEARKSLVSLIENKIQIIK